jgi:DHA1 family bicyclomycin/chloramphenicol resistance-like MFS transporter
MTYASFFAFLSGAPIVLRSYGVGPEGVGWYVMFVTFSYIAGNFVTSRAVRRFGERGMMRLGQLSAFAGIALMLALGLAGLKTPLAFAMPLILLGLGHGFLMPPTLSGTVGVIPALAGAAAAVAGLMQQLMGAVGSYVVGWVPHDGATSLGIVMMTFTLGSVGAQFALHRRCRRRGAGPAAQGTPGSGACPGGVPFGFRPPAWACAPARAAGNSPRRDTGRNRSPARSRIASACR